MSRNPPSRSPARPLPPNLLPDELTAYIYRHYSQLLTEEELAAERVRVARAKQFSYRDGNRAVEVFRLPEVQAKYPDLMRRIDEHGAASVMRAAAERVLRDNPEKKLLHTCAKCGALCRTPRARQCFSCGFDWHSNSEGG